MISVTFSVLYFNMTDNYCTSGINKPAWQQEFSVCTRNLLRQLAMENGHGLHCEDSGVPRCDALSLGKWLQTFCRIIVPPSPRSSSPGMIPCTDSKHLEVFTR